MTTRYFPYTLTTRAPMLLPAPDGDANRVGTLAYVGGATVRGAVARALGDPNGDADREALFHTLVLSGAVSYLNAYPAASGTQPLRALPTPVSLRVAKDDSARTVFDLAAYSGAADDEEAWPPGSLERLDAEFLAFVGGQLVPVHVARSSRVHQQRDRTVGRAWTRLVDGREEEHGTIFTYDALDSGQQFVGIVVVHGSDDAMIDQRVAAVRAALGDRLLLGRSRRAGYGGDAVITWTAPRRREVADAVLQPGDLIDHDLPAGDRFRVLLTSSYIGRDRWTGQNDPTALVREVQDRLNNVPEFLLARMATGVVGGYNRRWGLPLPRTSVAREGTVIHFRATVAIPFERLQALEDLAIGERRAEGFGRVVVLGEPAREFDLSGERPREPHAAPAGEPPAAVHSLQAHILDDLVAKTVAAEAASIAAHPQGRVSPSLLGRLRVPLRGEPAAALLVLRTWLDGGDNGLKPPAMRQLEACRLGGHDGGQTRSLADWLRAAVDSQGLEVASWLTFDALAQRGHLTTEERALAYLVSQLPRLRVRLIDAVLAVLSRQVRLEEERRDAT